jgi:hypothetical protein
MQMRIEVQAPTEGVGHHHDESANTVPNFQVLLYHCACEGWQVVKEMPILLKDRPENIRHREGNSNVGDIWKGSPLLPLP